jgi:hypothetical protein
MPVPSVPFDQGVVDEIAPGIGKADEGDGLVAGLLHLLDDGADHEIGRLRQPSGPARPIGVSAIIGV